MTKCVLLNHILNVYWNRSFISHCFWLLVSLVSFVLTFLNIWQKKTIWLISSIMFLTFSLCQNCTMIWSWGIWFQSRWWYLFEMIFISRQTVESWHTGEEMILESHLLKIDFSCHERFSFPEIDLSISLNFFLLHWVWLKLIINFWVDFFILIPC